MNPFWFGGTFFFFFKIQASVGKEINTIFWDVFASLKAVEDFTPSQARNTDEGTIPVLWDEPLTRVGECAYLWKLP